MPGRIGLYEDWITEDGLITIEGWAREGLTDKQIAEEKIGIHVATLCEWKKRFPELAEALKKGKAPVDTKVENQLLKSALGFTVKVKVPFKLKKKITKNGEGTVEEERIEYADQEIYVKPETTAQIYWLSNRRPDKWRRNPTAEKGADDPLLVLLKRWEDAANADADSKPETT